MEKILTLVMLILSMLVSMPSFGQKPIKKISQNSVTYSQDAGLQYFDDNGDNLIVIVSKDHSLRLCFADNKGNLLSAEKFIPNTIDHGVLWLVPYGDDILMSVRYLYSTDTKPRIIRIKRNGVVVFDKGFLSTDPEPEPLKPNEMSKERKFSNSNSISVDGDYLVIIGTFSESLYYDYLDSNGFFATDHKQGIYSFRVNTLNHNDWTLETTFFSQKKEFLNEVLFLPESFGKGKYFISTGCTNDPPGSYLQILNLTLFDSDLKRIWVNKDSVFDEIYGLRGKYDCHLSYNSGSIYAFTEKPYSGNNGKETYSYMEFDSSGLNKKVSAELYYPDINSIRHIESVLFFRDQIVVFARSGNEPIAIAFDTDSMSVQWHEKLEGGYGFNPSLPKNANGSLNPAIVSYDFDTRKQTSTLFIHHTRPTVNFPSVEYFKDSVVVSWNSLSGGEAVQSYAVELFDGISWSLLTETNKDYVVFDRTTQDSSVKYLRVSGRNILGLGNPSEVLRFEMNPIPTGPNSLVSIPEVNVNIFPNPSYGKFFIEPEFPGTIEIYSMDGKAIISEEISGKAEINISMPGIYFYVFSTDNQSASGRIIVK